MIFFVEKYDTVGKLLKPGEAHNSYSDEDEDPNTSTSTPSATIDKTEDDEKVESVESKVETVEPEQKEPVAAASDKPKEEEKPKSEWPNWQQISLAAQENEVDNEDENLNFHKFCDMFSL